MQAGEPADPAAAAAAAPQRGVNGGRFDFDDGGTYCGGWEDHKANGHGVCTGPKGQGAYSGSWHYGFEVSGVYTWPSGSSFEGQWQNGKRHGLGVETRGRWLYRGEWTQGFKGRYGVRQSSTSNAKFEGTWAYGQQDGYGSETYADGGTYQGQWLRGTRHGYGVRASAPFGLASHYRSTNGGAGAQGGTGVGARDPRGSTSSLAEGAPGTPDAAEHRTARIDESRGGFVLKARSDEPPARRNSLVEKTKKGLLSGLKIRKQRSTGELEKRGTGAGGSIRSGGSASSWVSSVDSSHSGVTHASLHTDSNASFIVEDEHLDASVTETYMGEWKNDKRTGFGVSERSDGLRYEGEWFANRKYGYGVTTFRDGSREEGKYKNNVLITSQKRKHIFLMRSAKFRERIDAAVNAAQRASKIALQKADIAISRTATARGKAEQADEAADQAKEDCDLAQMTAKQFAPDFKQPGMDRIRLRPKYHPQPDDLQPSKSILHEPEKSIPNHVPPLPQQPPATNKIPNPLPARRPSAVYPKTVQPNETWYNNTGYPSADPALNAPLDHMYEYRNDASAIPSNAVSPPPAPAADRFQQPLPEQQAVYPHGAAGGLPNNQVPSVYRTPNRQEAINYQHQSQVDNTQAYQQTTQERRQSYQPTIQNQRPVQPDWNSAQDGHRRPSVLRQANQDVRNQHGHAPGDYGRNDYRSGAVHPDGAPDRPGAPPLRPGEQQYSRQPGEQQYSRQPGEQQYSRQPGEPQYSRQPGEQQYSWQPGEQQYARQPGDYATAGDGGGRDARQASARPPFTGHQASIDHFDHYKRPPSRDSSVDRYGRRSRQPSVEGSGAPASGGMGSRSGSTAPAGQASAAGSRAATPAGNGHLATGRGSRGATREPLPLDDTLVRKRNVVQEASPSQPKRTGSLFVPGNPTAGAGGGVGGVGGRSKMPAQPLLQRKKSLPDVQGQQGAPDMSRPVVAAMGSARREELRRMAEENERLKANPLLYLVSPQVKDWFSRQQLVILVLFINISLAIMFFKLLT